MPKQRAIGVDLGARRIGIAITDGLGMTAEPHATLARRGGVRDLEAIAAVVRDLDAGTVVLGLPVDPSGEEGPAARRARAFAERLRPVVGVPVEMVDEQFSTVEAEDVLLEANLSRRKRKQVIDRVAAAVILRRWLDSRPVSK